MYIVQAVMWQAVQHRLHRSILWRYNDRS